MVNRISSDKIREWQCSGLNQRVMSVSREGQRRSMLEDFMIMKGCMDRIVKECFYKKTTHSKIRDILFSSSFKDQYFIDHFNRLYPNADAPTEVWNFWFNLNQDWNVYQEAHSRRKPRLYELPESGDGSSIHLLPHVPSDNHYHIRGDLIHGGCIIDDINYCDQKGSKRWKKYK